MYLRNPGTSNSIVEYVSKIRKHIAAMKTITHENQVESQRRQRSITMKPKADRLKKETTSWCYCHH